MTTHLKRSTLRLTLLAAGLALANFVLPAAARTSNPPSVDRNAYTNRTAPTLFVDADGTRLAYRRFGRKGGVPLVFFQHLAGTLDNWDPKVTDGFAKDREVILFDNAGVASSGGEVPTTIEGMAKHAINLLVALDIKMADLLGFSTGSFIAQEVTVERPDLVRRLVLVGSAPRGGVGMASLTPEFQAMLAKTRDDPDTLLLDALFSPTPTSQAAGREFVARLHERTVDRDIAISDKVAPAQITAIAAWGTPSANADGYLKAIQQPVLLVDGKNDLVFYTVNAFNLQQHLPNARLSIYPDSGHAPQYRFPELFVGEVTAFLK